MEHNDNPDWLALLAGICDDPAADLPRLVAADWLEERGDKASAARAEFVRVQCEWSAMVAADPDALPSSALCANCGHLVGSESDGPTLRCRGLPCRLLRRERDLAARHRIDWDREVLAVLVAAGRRVHRSPLLPGPSEIFYCYAGWDEFAALPFQGSLHYARGFVSRLTLPAAAFAEYGAALFAAAPVEQVAFPNLGVRVDIAPPGEGHEWEAYFHSAANAGYIAMDLWEQRHEVAAGISAVVAGWPELATARQ